MGLMLVNFMYKAHAEEVEIVYSPEAIAELLSLHQLNPKIVYTKLCIDAAKLATLQQQFEPGSFVHQLIQAVKDWPQNNDAASFATGINELIYLWLNAFDNGTKIGTLLNIVQHLHFKGALNTSKSPKFHLFLHYVLIETLNQYHEATVNYILNYDENTQLPNTKELITNLALALNQENEGELTALFSLRFKVLSNHISLQKTTPQALNKQLANILKKNIRNHSQLYFTGDYEFELLLSKVSNAVQLDLLIAKLSRAFEEIILVNNQSILVSLFIGISSSKTKKPSAHDLHHHAKLALEHAITKQVSYIMYSNELANAVREQAALESKVLAAFDNNNLSLNLQPIMDLTANRCVGAELLLRYSDSTGHNIPPNIVVEVLHNVEKKGKLFTHWLINTACRYAHEITTQHQLDLYLTLNLRAEDLYDAELPTLFSNALALWKLNPKHIILEITENGILEYNEHSNTVICALSELGFKFALDDFGTGFSSLTRLRELPIDVIKIDQSFIKDIHDSKKDYEIVQSIALLAKSLGKEVLAEGVEDEECLNQIKALNIDKCQGYHFAKALPYEAFIEWVKAY